MSHLVNIFISLHLAGKGQRRALCYKFIFRIMKDIGDDDPVRNTNTEEHTNSHLHYFVFIPLA